MKPLHQINFNDEFELKNEILYREDWLKTLTYGTSMYKMVTKDLQTLNYYMASLELSELLDNKNE